MKKRPLVVQGVQPAFQLDFGSPPFRRFPQRPSGIFVEEVQNHIRATAAPETCGGLYRGRLPRDARYQIIQRVVIDGKKRETGDMAPCPMCTPNRFLKGVLAWFPDLQVASVIGHCCAVNADDAEREFTRSETFRRQEDYLLAALPRLAAKRATLASLRGAAAEAQRVYRAFRRKTPTLHQHLRHVKDRANATLTLTEVIGGEDGRRRDYIGPAGFRGSAGGVDSRDIQFGRLRGTTAVIGDYRPEVDLNDAIRMADVFPFDGSEEDALELIVGMSDTERRAAVATLQGLDNAYTKFSTRIRDFGEFWSPENVERLNQYGSHPLNPQPFSIGLVTLGRQCQLYIRIRQGHQELHTALLPQLFDIEREWEAFTY